MKELRIKDWILRLESEFRGSFTISKKKNPYSDRKSQNYTKNEWTEKKGSGEKS